MTSYSNINNNDVKFIFSTRIPTLASQQLTTIPDVNLESVEETADPGEIEEYAVKWIRQHKEMYECFGEEAEKAYSYISECKPEQYEKVLNSFSKLFFNNIYMYEKKITDTYKPSYISASHILCYFVRFCNVTVPLAVLGIYFDADDMTKIIKWFLGIQNTDFYNALVSNCEKCNKYTNGLSSDEKTKKRFFSGIVLWGGLFLFIALVVLKRIIMGVNFGIILPAFKSGAKLFQIIGIITHEAYGIDINCTLNTIILVASLLWLVVGILIFKPVLREVRNHKDYSKKYELLKTCELLKSVLDKCIRQDATRKKFIENKGDEIKATVAGDFDNAYIIDGRAKCLNAAGPIESSYIPEPKLPGKGLAVFLIVLMLLTCYLNVNSAKPEFQETYNAFMLDISDGIKDTAVYAYKGYCVTEPTAVYSSPDENGMEIYVISPSEPFEWTYENEESTDYYGIRFRTEYGDISGWIKKTGTVLFKPSANPDMTKQYPAALTASSTAKGKVNNINDGDITTVWGEGFEGAGIGEWVELGYNEAVPVDALAFRTGNCKNTWLFSGSDKPVRFTVNFYRSGTLQEVIDVTLETDELFKECKKIQYVCLNRTVMADKITFVIADIDDVKLNDVSYIAELAVYGTEKS